jgi:ribosomal protein S18 acetylase RimI-like enzyme
MTSRDPDEQPVGRDQGSPHRDELVVERVVEVSEAQADALGRLLPQLSEAPVPDRAALSAIASSPGTSLVIARLGEDVVGSLTLVVFAIPTGRRALVEDVVVDSSVRGRGIGSALVLEALRIAHDAGCRNVDLTSRPSREAANRLYARAGFVRRDTNVWRYSFAGPPGMPLD